MWHIGLSKTCFFITFSSFKQNGNTLAVTWLSKYALHGFITLKKFNTIPGLLQALIFLMIKIKVFTNIDFQFTPVYPFYFCHLILGVDKLWFYDSVQNRLLDLLVKSQGWTTTRTWAVSNFFCGLAVCDVSVCLRCLYFCRTCDDEMQEYVPAPNVFASFLLTNCYYYGTLLQRALFSGLHLGINSWVTLWQI